MKLINPKVTLSPTDFSSSGTMINATVSLLNRPEYMGDPDGIEGLTTITPKIVISRSPSGIIPFHVMVSACETTHDGVDGGTYGNTFQSLDYRWDFGEPSGNEIDIDYYNGSAHNLNIQYSPQAAYCYRNPGEYTITLTVKGKKTDGTYVTASTTTLYQLGEYYIHLGAANSGTYTLYFNGEATSPINWSTASSGVKAALYGLSALDSGNTYVSYYDMIQFHNDLIGTDYSFSGDFSNIVQTSGLENTPRIFIEESPASYSGVTVVGMSGLSIRYYDSNYDGSSGVSDGTINRPYTDFTNLKSWIEAVTFRGVALKTDSNFLMNQTIEFGLNNSNIRFFAYGNGNQPVIRQENAYFNPRLGTGQSEYPSGKIIDDIVFSDIEFDFAGGGTVTNSFSALIVSQSNAGAYPHTRFKNFVFDKLTWSSSAVDPNPAILATARLFSATIPPSKGGSLMSRFSAWRCNADGSNSTQLAFINTRMAHWTSYVGGTYGGGGESDVASINSLIHSLYPSCIRYGIYKHLGFWGPTWKNQCINTNAHPFGGRHSYSVLDGCDFTGHQNGFDLSNSNNSWTSGRNGHFDQVVVSCCKIHSGQLTSQQIGIISYNLYRLTIQHCDFYGNNQANIKIESPTGYPWAPIIDAWHCNFKDGRTEVRGIVYPQTPRYRYCTFESTNGDRCFIFFDGTENYINEFNCNNNIMYCSLGSPFSEFSWAEWQSAGNDANGQNVQPNWPSTSLSGVFVNEPVVSLDWPTGFTNLEYSLDNSSWSSYTDASNISLGASASGVSEIYFRALAPAADGSFTIYGYSDSSTSGIVSESGYAILTTSLPPQTYLYFTLNFSGGSLILKRAE